jgi:hypothetical protein
MRSHLAPLVFGLLVACSGKSTSTTNEVSISWGIQQAGEMADVYLATTDETGGQQSHSIGRYKGICSPFTPSAPMNAKTGVLCANEGGSGTELHAVIRESEIIVLQVGFKANVPADPMAREQVTSIPIPLGVAVEVAQ